MELRHLRYFAAVAETENVTRAALNLHVSQPALSRQIHDLEHELGFPLLERSAKSVRLTAAGRAFLRESLAVLKRADDAVKVARDIAKSGGELHVGYAPSPTARILPQSLQAFQAAMPAVRVRLYDMTGHEMLAGLRARTLQFAFTVRPSHAALRGLRFEELIRDPICLAVPPKHPLARRRTISLAEAAQEPIVTYSRKDYPDAFAAITGMFAAVKRKPRIAAEHDSVSSLIASVESGAGVALAPESLTCLVGRRLKLIPFLPVLSPIAVGLAWLDTKLTLTGEQFVKSAKEAALKR